MNFKKYVEVSDTWTDSHYIMGTSTDTITTLPADIYPNDTTATVEVKGQMAQSSTPSPSSPVMPQECGDKTANLFDYKTAYAAYLQPDGSLNATASQIYQVLNYFDANAIGQTITISVKATNVLQTRVMIVTKVNDVVQESNAIFTNNTGIMSITVTPTSTNDYWRIAFGSGGSLSTNYSNMMLNTGSTALPYQPYGYKIPISSASTTTPVYLGEVQSTRQIVKRTFDGREYWTINLPSSNNCYFALSESFVPAIRTENEICSHLPYKLISASNTDVGFSIIADGTQIRMRLENASSMTLESFKQWLSDQSTAGTPVTVWYVLATETTGIVNEPIRKIGDYADEVSGITIPTIAGANAVDVLTTLKPSEATVNYKGWHEHQLKQYVGGVVNKLNYDYLFSDDYTKESTYFTYYKLQLKPNTQYTIKTDYIQYYSEVPLFFGLSDTMSTANDGVNSNTPKTITTGADGIAYIARRSYSLQGEPYILSYDKLIDGTYYIMLNEGSTALPYEPYYKWIED